MERAFPYFLSLLFVHIGITGEVSGTNSCPGLTEKERTKDSRILELEHIFSKTDEAYGNGYVVGFRFSGPIKNMLVYEDHVAYRINDKLWFVVKTYSHPEDAIFGVDILFNEPVEVEEISVNGKLLCSHVPHNKISVQDNNVLTPCLVVVGNTIVLCVIIVVLVSVTGLKRKTNDHWYQMNTLVLSLDRRFRQYSSPNTKDVPLPLLPYEKPKTSIRRPSNISITNLCKNPICFRTNSILSELMSQLSEEAEELSSPGYCNPTLVLELDDNEIKEEDTDDEERNNTGAELKEL